MLGGEGRVRGRVSPSGVGVVGEDGVVRGVERGQGWWVGGWGSRLVEARRGKCPGNECAGCGVGRLIPCQAGVAGCPDDGQVYVFRETLKEVNGCWRGEACLVEAAGLL